MANKETIFLLSDDDEDQGMEGFNDAPDFPSEDEDKEDAGLVLVKDPENKPDESDADKSTDESGETKKEDDPEKEPEIDPAEQRFNELAGMYTNQQEQMNAILEQNKILTEKMTAEPEIKKDPPQKPQLTAQDWEDDPEACNEAFYDYRKENDAFENDQAQAAEEKQTSETTANLQAVHQKDWVYEVAETPALDNPQLKQVWADIYYKGGFSTQQDGVIRATREFKRQAKEQNIDLATFGQAPNEEPPKEEPIDQEEAKRKGAEDEQARQQRVRSSAMQSSTNQSKSSTTTLSATQKATARRFGVSDEAYARTLKSMGGK